MADTIPTFTQKPIYCGDTATIPIQCRRSDGVTAISLSGATLKGTLKRGNQVIATFLAGSGITVTDSPGGNANLTLLQTHTDKPPGVCTLDVLCIEADGTRSSVSGEIMLVDHPSR